MFVMDTTTFSVFGVSPYFFMAGLGAVLSYLFFSVEVSVYSAQIRKYSLILFASIIGLLLGARFFGFVVAVLNDFQSQGKITVQIFRESASVFYGGLTGFLTAYFLLCRIFHVQDSKLNDIVAICIPCFHGFARVGCFMAGCCYGRRYDGWGAVYYINFDSEALRFPV